MTFSIAHWSMPLEEVSLEAYSLPYSYSSGKSSMRKARYKKLRARASRKAIESGIPERRILRRMKKEYSWKRPVITNENERKSDSNE